MILKKSGFLGNAEPFRWKTRTPLGSKASGLKFREGILETRDPPPLPPFLSLSITLFPESGGVRREDESLLRYLPRERKGRRSVWPVECTERDLWAPLIAATPTHAPPKTPPPPPTLQGKPVHCRTDPLAASSTCALRRLLVREPFNLHMQTDILTNQHESNNQQVGQ